MERLTLEKLCTLYMLHKFGGLKEPFLNITRWKKRCVLMPKDGMSLTALCPTREHPLPCDLPSSPSNTRALTALGSWNPPARSFPVSREVTEIKPFFHVPCWKSVTHLACFSYFQNALFPTATPWSSRKNKLFLEKQVKCEILTSELLL